MRHDLAAGVCKSGLLWAASCHNAVERYAQRGPYRHPVPLQVDVWAAGVCLYVWIFGELPFQALSMVDMFAAIRTQALAFPDSPGASEEVKDLIGQVCPRDSM